MTWGVNSRTKGRASDIFIARMGIIHYSTVKMRHSVILILVVLAAFAVFASPARAEGTITVIYDDGRAGQEFSSWKLNPDSEALYLRANDVALLFKATQFWNASSRKVVLGIGRTRFTLTVDTRVVVVDGEPILLRNPIRYDAGFVMIPMEFVLEVAPPFTPSVLDWNPVSQTLYVEKVGYNVESIVFSSTTNRATATITLTEPLVHHVDSSTPGLIRLKIYGGRVDPAKFESRKGRGLFNGVRAEQTERDAYVYFDIERETARILVEREKDPPRIVVVLEKGELPEIPDPEFADRRQVQIIDRRAQERRDIRIETVVLDPGHGGKDDGKRGSTGLLEKNVNLAVALRTRDILERELGVRVILTREDDRLLALTRRTEIANETGGDLFLSIHCNSWFGRGAGGFEAYFLSPARTERDREVARAENAAGRFATPGNPDADVSSDIDFILWDMVQNEYINESSHLAELIQKAMSDRLEIRNRGVKQANFSVLQGAQMPAILIEVAFLSNPTEESLLTSDDFHRRVANGIVEAVRLFKERYEK